MDLGSLGLRDAVEVELYHPGNGKPLHMFVTILSQDSDVARRAMERVANKALKLAQHRGRPRTPEVDLDKDEADRIEVLATCTVSWREVTTTDNDETSVPYWTMAGERLECTPENVRKVFGDPALRWIFRQLWTVHISEAHFATP